MDKPPTPDDAFNSSPSALTPSEIEPLSAISPDARDDEIRALRERLAFYESFDSLIRDNITRAGQLLREAANKQVDAEVELRRTTVEQERRQLEERGAYRRVFSGILDEVTTVQGQVERLARQVADALDDLESQLPAAGELAAIERGELPSIPGISGSAPMEHEEREAPPPTPAVMTSEEEDGDELAFEEYVDDALAGDIAFTDRDPLGEDELTDALLGAEAEGYTVAVALGMVTHSGGEPAEPNDGGHDVLLAEHVPSPISDAAAATTASVLAHPTVADAGPHSDDPDAMQDVVADGDAALVDTDPGVVVEADDMERVAAEGSEQAESSDRFHEAAMEHVAPEEPVTAEELREPEAMAEAEPSDSLEVGQAEEIDAGPVASEQQDDMSSDLAATDSYGEQGTGQSDSESEPDEVAFAGTPMTDATSLAASNDSENAGDENAVEEPQDTVLLVHGVPRATTALSLKRYLEGLSAVRGVEPREYAEGVLRLHVSSARPIRIEDLSGWPDGSGLEAVTARDDLLEVRLPR